MLDILVQLKIIYKYGVTFVTFVHFEFGTYWQIKSFKMSRTDREKAQKKSNTEIEASTCFKEAEKSESAKSDNQGVSVKVIEEQNVFKKPETIMSQKTKKNVVQ